MYAHQVIEGLDWYINQYNSKRNWNTPENIALEKRVGFYVEFLRRCRDPLRTSTKFHLGEISKIHATFKHIYGKPIFEVMTEYMKLPYKYTWIDYVVDARPGEVLGPDQASVRKRGILACDTTEDKNFPKITFILFNYHDSLPFNYFTTSSYFTTSRGGKWTMGPVFYEAHLEERPYCTWLHAASEIYVLHGDEINKEHPGRVISRALTPMTQEQNFAIVRDDITDITTLSFFLLLLNCKNITKEKIEPDAKLNKKRLKNNRLPLFSYHVLKIDLNQRGKKSSGGKANNVSNISTRIHFCRGHFKEYTAEAPLFGKYTGLYWWQPHIRGDKNRGIVLKEYTVQP